MIIKVLIIKMCFYLDSTCHISYDEGDLSAGWHVCLHHLIMKVLRT